MDRRVIYFIHLFDDNYDYNIIVIINVILKTYLNIKRTKPLKRTCMFMVGLMFFSCYQVKAFDKDPPENGGTISNYTFVAPPGERPKFSIDRLTGVITTRYVSISYYLHGVVLYLLPHGKSLVNTIFGFRRCSIETSRLVKKKCT